MIVTISQMLHISFTPVLSEMRGSNAWVSPLLNELEKSGRLTHRRINSSVKIGDKEYPPLDVTTPIKWSCEDEITLVSERDRVQFVAQLIKDGIRSHDALLLEQIGDRAAVASDYFRYCLGESVRRSDSTLIWASLYTAIAIAD